MPKRSTTPGSPPVYATKPLTPRSEDSYKSRGKLPDPSLCPDCGAVFAKGRWHWGEAAASAHRERCPACHRIHDRVPAGYVTLEGEFFAAHREEVLAIARNLERKERATHPLQRIMEVAETPAGGVLVTTTDSHLARAIGDAVRHAYQGELQIQYSEDENLARVRWVR